MLLTAVLSVCPGMVPLLLLDPPDDAAICKSPEILARMADGQAPEGAVAGNGHTTDVLHYDLDLEIVPADTWLGGSNAILARSLVDDLTVFPIRLHDAFDITAVTSGGIPATWQRISPETIEVQLDRAYQTDETFEVSIAYDGNPQPGGFGSINFQSEGGLPLVYTLSEPWYAYTWWPAKDDNTDKATGDLSFTAPDELTVASNGALLSVEDLGDGRKVHHWSTGYQTATYLFSFSAAGYNTFSETFVHDQGTMPVEFFIFPGSDNQSNRDGWAESVAMLEVFTELFGPYPFLDEKYGIYEFGFGGGMEHQTMTGQGGFGESLTAHELAHQWWGDMITCATWQDIWLNEGFATYGEALWKEFKNGSSNPTALHAHMASRRPNNVNGSVWIPADEATSINRIFSGNYSYRKAAWVLHQLRHVVGDAAFFDTLATYRQTFEYDAALTAEFIAVAEAIHGADLDWFFDPWLYGLGAPEYESAWEIYELDGTTWLEIYVKQVQSGSYPIFPMPLDVRLTGPVLNETRVIWNDEPAEHFLLEVPDGVGAMVLDPNDWTLHTSNETTAFVEGPPRVVDTSPAPGEAIEWTAGGLILVSFHKDVLADEQDFILVGDNTGEIGVNMSFNGSMSVVELLPAMSLAPDDYTLTVKDTVIDVAGELELDGELLDAIDPGSLPSGEGLPGGDAILRFTVLAPPIDADVNDDGVVDVSDLVAVILAWGPCPSPPAECPADVNGDGEVSVADLVEVVLAWN